MTGFEVFGAVAGALGTLSLALTLSTTLYKSVRQHNSAAAKMLDLKDNFENFQARLEVWAESWDIKDAKEERYYVALWSTQGWKSISKQLNAIDRTCEDYAKILYKLLGPEEIRTLETSLDANLQAIATQINNDGSNEKEIVKQQSAARTGVRALRVARTRKLRDLAKKAMTWNDKARFVFTKSDQLSKYFDELNENFTTMNNDAFGFFTATHPSAEGSASVLARRNLVAASMLLQRAFQTKAASEALYRSCLSSPEGEFVRCNLPDTVRSTRPNKRMARLEMDFLLDEARNALQSQEERRPFPALHYHLLIASSNSTDWQEIVVHGPVQQDIDDQARSRTELTVYTIEAAFSALRTAQSCELQTSLTDDPPDALQVPQINNLQTPETLQGTRLSNKAPAQSTTLRFHLTLPPDPIGNDLYKEVFLSGLLAEIQAKTSADSHERFPLCERLDLAYKVAECGLILLGTSWLSDISSKRVQRIWCSGKHNQRRRYVLEAGKSADEDLASVEPQTFNVGVLLTEIATAQPVLGILRFHTDLGVELDLVTALVRGGVVKNGMWRAAQVVNSVDEHMGKRYSKAVDFCLQQSQKYKRPEWARIRQFGSWQEREDAYRTIIQDYYIMVYSPLKELHQCMTKLTTDLD